MSEKKRALCILNPNAGRKGKGQRKWLSLQNLFDVEYDIVLCPADKRIVELVDHLDGTDLVICVGGDGTLHHTVNIIRNISSSVPILFIPTGTTNDFAYSIQVSNKKNDVVQILEQMPIKQHDVGVFNTDTAFVYVAAFGAFVNIASQTPQHYKNRYGYFAYFFRGIKSLKTLSPVHAIINAGSQQIQGEYLFGFVSNSLSVGKMLRIKKENVVFNDGKMEMLLVRYPKNIRSYLMIAYELISRKYHNHVELYHNDMFDFSFEQNIDWTVDGEPMTASKQTHVRVANNAISMCVSPQRSSSSLYTYDRNDSE